MSIRERLADRAAAGHEGAEIVTKPLKFSGDRLELNLDCSAGGHLNLELQSADGQPLPATTLADCDRIYHNNIRKTVTWKDQSGLWGLAGQPVRLRIVMRDCRLGCLLVLEQVTVTCFLTLKKFLIELKQVKKLIPLR